MNLVVHQMMQFHNIHRSHGNLVIKGLTAAAIVEDRLAGLLQPGF